MRAHQLLLRLGGGLSDDPLPKSPNHTSGLSPSRRSAESWVVCVSGLSGRFAQPTRRPIRAFPSCEFRRKRPTWRNSTMSSGLGPSG
jgi:hypothetical protein